MKSGEKELLILSSVAIGGLVLYKSGFFENISRGLGTGLSHVFDVSTGAGMGLAAIGGGFEYAGAGLGNTLTDLSIPKTINALYGNNPQSAFTGNNVGIPSIGAGILTPSQNVISPSKNQSSFLVSQAAPVQTTSSSAWNTIQSTTANIAIYASKSTPVQILGKLMPVSQFGLISKVGQALPSAASKSTPVFNPIPQNALTNALKQKGFLS